MTSTLPPGTSTVLLHNLTFLLHNQRIIGRGILLTKTLNQNTVFDVLMIMYGVCSLLIACALKSRKREGQRYQRKQTWERSMYMQTLKAANKLGPDASRYFASSVEQIGNEMCIYMLPHGFSPRLAGIQKSRCPFQVPTFNCTYTGTNTSLIWRGSTRTISVPCSPHTEYFCALLCTTSIF